MDKQYLVDSAIQQRDTAEMDCLRNFRELMTAINYDPGKERLTAILTEWYQDKETAKALIESCEASIKAYDKAQNDFLEAVKAMATQLR